MRTIQNVRAFGIGIALGACMFIAGAARADVTMDVSTERPGSILIFPKVVRDGTRDTVIQITNTSSMPDCARCFYLNGQPGRNGQPLCTSTDFFVCLTKQQPTHWEVSEGRPVDPRDDETGIDPGLIPPVPPGFIGALICNEVD